MPRRWEVIGGGSKGGVVVRKEADVTSVEEANRLATGSLLNEVDIEGDRLHYSLLSGEGPASGWVSTKFRDKDLVVRTEKEPPLLVWEVVGGGSSGGIVVRSGKETSSPTESARLTTGALIRQLTLDGERLQYELLEGSGPTLGWVSLKLKDKELVVRSDKKPGEASVPEQPEECPVAAEFLRLLCNHEDASWTAWQKMLEDGLGDDAGETTKRVERCLKDSLKAGQKMEYPDTKVARKALRALAGLGHAQPLVECLATASDAYTRAEAALLLERVKPSQESSLSATALVQALSTALASDSAPLVRLWAARTLWRLPAADAAAASEALTEAARSDTDGEVRKAAAASARGLGCEVAEADEKAEAGQSAGLGPVVGRKLRVLAIHGAAANTKVLKMQVAQFKGALGGPKEVEWFFVDSPLLWQPIPGSNDPLFSERTDAEKMLAGTEPFRWWYAHGNQVYGSVEEGVANFRNFLTQHDPIDVVVSFSQGSNLVSLVIDSFRKEGLPVPWRVSVYFSGGQIDDELFRFPHGWTSSQPLVRSYAGGSDDYFHGGEPPLTDMFTDSTQFGHEDGHGFPRTQPRAKEIFTAMAAEVRKKCGL